MLTGDPGIGKSTLVCEIIACLTTGRPLPGMVPGSIPPSECWILNAEDAADDTIVWRLDNQGADRSRVQVTDQARPLDERAMKQIDQVLGDLKIKFMVVDPVQAWTGSKIDIHRSNEVREWTEPLRNLAVFHKTAIMFIRHRRKGAAGDNRIQSGYGSIDFTGAVRSENSAIEAKDGTKFIARIKGNVGVVKGTGLAYILETHPDPENDHGILRWQGAYNEEAIKEKKTASRVPKAMGRAILFLQGFLNQGPRTAKECFTEGLKSGISESTLKRAAHDMVDRSRDGDKMLWALKTSSPFEDMPLVQMNGAATETHMDT